jgi:hypothetical protein
VSACCCLQIAVQLPFIIFEGDGDDIDRALVSLNVEQRATLDALVKDVSAVQGLLHAVQT